MQLNNMLPHYTREGDRHDTAEMAELGSVLADKISSDRILNPYESLNSYDVNSNAPIISGYPMLSILQGEPICDVVSDSIMADHAAFGDSNTRVSRSAQPLIYENKDSSFYNCHSARLPEQIMGGTLLSATTLANLLASRSSSVHENSNDLVISAPAIFPSNSSFASPSNCSNAVLGDKWGFGNFLPSCELAGKSPEGMNFQPSDGNEWISANSNVVSDHLYGCSKFSSELSLGLATSQPCANRTSLPDHCAEMSCSGISNHSINGTGYGLDQTPGNSKEFYDTGRPYHFSQVIAGSKYLTVLQDILAEIAHYSLANPDQMSYNAAARRIFTANSDDFTDGDGSEDHQMVSAAQARVMEAKKSQLLGLLQMVDDQYNQCIDEVHMVISAFHAATEIDPQMHSRFALQTISCLYKNLRERISSHILGMGAHTRSTARDKDSIFESSFIQKQWALQQLRRKEHQLWKPQRGLPERSASVLRAWMFQNFLHPYPKDSEKHLLAIKSGLTRSQVSNWFINARVRLWKPMIEEMYAEMNRQKAHKNHREVSNTRVPTGIDIQRFRLA